MFLSGAEIRLRLLMYLIRTADYNVGTTGDYNFYTANDSPHPQVRLAFGLTH